MRRILPLSIALALAMGTAEARSIRVDMAGADNFDFSGEDWTVDNAVGSDLAGDSFVSGVIPFQLNFGAGAADYSFCFTENGFVSFTQAPGCNSLLPPSGDFIAPFANDIAIDSALWSVGLLDPLAPYSRDEDTEAMRFTWQGTDTNNAQLVAQLVLLNRGSGNFDFEINYGPAFSESYVTSNAGGQGWSLGANTQALTTGAFSGFTTNYFFSMVNGVLSGGTPPDPPDPTPVDEPSMLVLLALAALTLLAVYVRRRLRLLPHFIRRRLPARA